MHNPTPAKAPVRLGWIEDYGRDIADQVRYLPPSKMGEAAVDAALLIEAIGTAANRIDVLRREAWSHDGDLTRCEALADALAELDKATAWIPPHFLWPSGRVDAMAREDSE